jgi:hypothetical protein
MSITEISAEQLAELFHLYHEALAEGVAGRNGTHPGWSEISQPERKRMVAAVRLALLDLGFAAKEPAKSKPHFATPGEAEWGC